jgi:HSP20 family protein
MTLMKVDQSNLFPSLSNMWEDFFGRDITDLPSWRSGTSIPAVNIEEKPNEFLVSLAAPGMKRDDFKIEVDNGLLTVSSEKEEIHEDKGGKFTRREFSYQSFKRSFTLPEGVKTDQIEAKYADGILTIHLPKREEVKLQPARRIEIK